MYSGLIFTIGCLFPLILIDIVYLLQERRKTTSTTVFKNLIFTNILMDVFEILCSICLYHEKNVPLGNILFKLHWVFGTLFFYMFFLYLYTILKNIKSYSIKELFIKDKSIIIFNIFSFIAIVVQIIMPLPKEDYNNLNYLPEWLSYVTIIYAIITFIILTIIFIIRKKENKGNLKLLIVLYTLSSLYVLFQVLFQNLALGPYAASFLIISMYIMKENPNIYIGEETNALKNDLEMNNLMLNKFMYDIKSSIVNELNNVSVFDNKYLNSNVINSNEFNNDISKVINSVDSALISICNKTVFVDRNSYYKADFKIYSIVQYFYHFALIKLNNSNVRLKVSIESGLPVTINGNENVFFYLLSTSFMASLNMTKLGIINITLSKVNIDNNNYMRITVIDTGSGKSIEEYQNIINSDINYLLISEYLKIFNGYYTIEGKKDFGTTFTMYLPISSASNEVMNGVEFSDDTFKTTIKDYEQKKILLVEKDQMSKYCLLNLLSIFNFNIVCIDDIQKAVDSIKQGVVYDSVFVDVSISNDYDVAKSIKELKRRFNLSIPSLIAIIPYNSVKYEKICYEYGFDFCISKAIDVNTINKLLSNK